MSSKSDFLELVKDSFSKEIIKKLVFSRPKNSEISKVSARLVAHRGKKMLAFEYSLPGNTVSHKNATEGELDTVLSELIDGYRQANLITTLGDAEWKISSSDKEVLLGRDKLIRKMSGAPEAFEKAIESLDKKKNYILNGDEDFLIKLGVSDKNGRVHDKRQGKFRQINRFLEHIEDIYGELTDKDELLIYDLCCGKSYLSFAVYYYLTKVKKKRVKLLGIDLKRDVITWCDALARELGYVGMTFIYDDVTNTPRDVQPDMVISLHACDLATDIVIDNAIALRARVILSTPCCHKYLNDKINAPELRFVSAYPKLRDKLCEALTDGIRLARLRANGYDVTALELTDPDDTPKNTLLRCILKSGVPDSVLADRQAEYERILQFVLGENSASYLKEINNGAVNDN